MINVFAYSNCLYFFLFKDPLCSDHILIKCVVDGKKSVHIATPHPMKKGGKTPQNAAKDQSPISKKYVFYFVNKYHLNKPSE